MMMEETSETGSAGDSEAPSFAMPPGGMIEDTGTGSEYTGTGSDCDNEESAAPAPPPAPEAVSADPFDLLSMTSEPTSTTAATNSSAAPDNGFDVFGSPTTATDAFASAPAQDFLGDGAGINTDTTNNEQSSAINIGAQDSMIGGAGRELKTAESGDLLGLGGGSERGTAAPPTASVDLMDTSFQSLPVEPPANAAIDPFESATNNSQPSNLPNTNDGPINNNNINTITEQPLSSSTSDGEQQQPPKAEPEKNQNGDDAEATPSPPPAPTSDQSPANTNGSADAEEPPKTDLSVNEVQVEDKATVEEEPATISPNASMQDVTMDESTAMYEEVDLASPSKERETTLPAAAESLKPPPFTEDEPKTTETSNSESPPAPVINEEQAARIKELEKLLAQAEARAGSLQAQKDSIEKQHKDSQEETTKILEDLKEKLQQEQTQRAEAENQCKIADVKIQRMQQADEEKEEQWKLQTEAWKQQLGGLEKENEALIEKAKQEQEDRKEHERRERVLANKLNVLKKQQASKTDVEDVYQDDLRLLKDDVAAKTARVEELEASEAALKEQLEQEKTVSQTRIEQLEKAVREEKQLNDERKSKMKSFIEAKTEELKEVKAESEGYQAELERNNQSMVDLNSRWKTLHAQWVQSQTRNRELQRDLNKIKKEYENRHKVQDSLNVKLSKSANETEQHKNKRLQAKQELMSVLGQLEAEREITNKLRDGIRFTFTAKAQSQHQLLQENLTEFNKQLESLARRLGRPLPLPIDENQQSLSSLVMAAVDESERSEGDDVNNASANGMNGGQESGASKEQRRILLETTRLLGKLENETQRISQGIMALSNGIEQMNNLIQGGGEKTCFTSLGGIFFGGGLAKAIEADQSRSPRGAPVRSGHSSYLPTESGMT